MRVKKEENNKDEDNLKIFFKRNNSKSLLKSKKINKNKEEIYKNLQNWLMNQDGKKWLSVYLSNKDNTKDINK